MKLTITYFLIFLFMPFTILADTGEAKTDSLNQQIKELKDEWVKSKRLKITGYLQPQYQHIDSAGAPSFAGGDFVNGISPLNSRFTMRRGRFKFTYNFENVEYLCNIDVTERTLAMRETFVKVTDPWTGIFSLTAGLLQDQFGFELTQSSGVRETPERARFNQILFPTERDLGAFLSITAPKNCFLKGLKADFAVMNGSAGVSPEFDSYKDYTGRLQYSHTSENKKVNWSAGLSAYYGGYRIGIVKDYKYAVLADGKKGYVFADDTANHNRLAERLYFSADAQFSIDWRAGTTTLRAEYIQGEQPGTDKTNRSPSALPSSNLYQRQFSGAYAYFIQNIGKSRFQVVLKYDWFDPNVHLNGNDIGLSGSGTKVGDIRFDTYGFGGTIKINEFVKLVLYYDYVVNESTLIAGYTKDIKDNVYTCRLQFRF